MKLLSLLLLLAAPRSFGQEQSSPIQDPAQLVGKQVIVHRMPLCQPGTYTVDLAHAGKQATVMSAKPIKFPPMSQRALNRLTPEMRAMIEDQRKAATLMLQFEDGAKFDTCAPFGPNKLAEYLDVVPGQIQEPVAPASPYPAAASASTIPQECPVRV